MAKLTFLEKRKFHRQGIKLTDEIYFSEKLNISLYAAGTEVWLVNKEKEIIKISEEKRKFIRFQLPENKEGQFLLGTEGLFYVNCKGVKKLYNNDIKGARIMSGGKILILFHKEKDLVLQLNWDGIEKTVIGNVENLGNNDIKEKEIFGTSSARYIIIREGGGRYLYTIGIQRAGLHKAKKVAD